MLILFKYHYYVIYKTIEIVDDSGRNDYCSSNEYNNLDKELCKMYNKNKKFLILYYDGFPYYMMKKLKFPKEKGYLMKINNIGLCDSGPSMHTIFSCNLTLTYRSSILHTDNVIEKLSKKYPSDFNLLGNDYTLDLLDIKKIKEYKSTNFGFHQILCEDFLDWKYLYNHLLVKKRFSDSYIEDENKIQKLIDEKLDEYRKILSPKKENIFECLKNKLSDKSFMFYIMRADNLAHIFTRQHPNFIKGTSMILANLEILIEYINKYDKDRVIVSTSDHGAADSYYNNEYVNHEKTYNNYDNYSYLFLYSNNFSNTKQQYKTINSNESAGIYSLFLGINTPVNCKISQRIDLFNNNTLKLYYLRNMHNSLIIKNNNLNIYNRKIDTKFPYKLELDMTKHEIEIYENFLWDLEKKIKSLKQDNLFTLNIISYILSIIFFIVYILPWIINKDSSKLILFEITLMFSYIYMFFDVPNENYFKLFCYIFIFINSIYCYLIKKRAIEFYIFVGINLAFILSKLSMIIPYVFLNLQNTTMAILTGIYLLFLTYKETKFYSFNIKLMFFIIDILLIIKDIYFTLQTHIYFQLFPDFLDHSLLFFFIGFIIFHILFDPVYGREKLIMVVIQIIYIFINHYEKVVYLGIFYYLLKFIAKKNKIIDGISVMTLILASFYLNLVTGRMFDWKPRERLQNRLPYKGLYMNIGFFLFLAFYNLYSKNKEKLKLIINTNNLFTGFSMILICLNLKRERRMANINFMETLVFSNLIIWPISILFQISDKLLRNNRK